VTAAKREDAAAAADTYDETTLGEDDTNGAGLRLRESCHARHEQPCQGQLNNPS
jgi:hypothetical protein